jgi:putative transposase
MYYSSIASFNQWFDSINASINWYNSERLHSSLEYLTPFEMEVKLRGFIKKAA